MKALITGVAGQDGSYLAEQLVARGYQVLGTIRPARMGSLENLEQVIGQIEIVELDLNAPNALRSCLATFQPDEVYHLAAPSFMPDSTKYVALAAEITTIAEVLIDGLAASAPNARLVVASSAEIFGDPDHAPQSEATPLRPVTPYAVAKAEVFRLVQSARLEKNMHASSAILFNHESPRRPDKFVTMKVVRAAVSTSLGIPTKLAIGRLDARRDWCSAVDVVRAMQVMAAQLHPDDYVIASGVAHSVEDLLELAFGHVGLAWQDHVTVDKSLERPPETHERCGDATRAKELLGWQATQTFEQLIDEMIRSESSRILDR